MSSYAPAQADVPIPDQIIEIPANTQHGRDREICAVNRSLRLPTSAGRTATPGSGDSRSEDERQQEEDDDEDERARLEPGSAAAP
jgi:hypothetical protein